MAVSKSEVKETVAERLVHSAPDPDRGAHAQPVGEPAAAAFAAVPTDSFDLLSLEEVRSCTPRGCLPKPQLLSTLESERGPDPMQPARSGSADRSAPAHALSGDDDWAAFVDSSVNRPSDASASALDGWDAFQGSSAQAGLAAAAQPVEKAANMDPFVASFEKMPAAQVAHPNLPTASLSTQPVPAIKSAEDILKFFDTPKGSSGMAPIPAPGMQRSGGYTHASGMALGPMYQQVILFFPMLSDLLYISKCSL